MQKRVRSSKKAPKVLIKKSLDRGKFELFCHDLRTPLAIVKMNIDLFKISPDYKNVPVETQKLLRTIEKQIQTLTLLIQKNAS